MCKIRQRQIWSYGLGFICLILSTNPIAGQAVGGNAVFNFIGLSPSAKTTALGGLNISQLYGDLGMAFTQPAFLNREMDGQLHLSIKPYVASINQYNFSGAHFVNRYKTSLSWGVQYMDYGTIPMTDIAGNEIGSFRPNEYAFQLSLSHRYQSNFNVGTSVKFLQSSYGIYHSNGIAADVGILYTPYNGLTQYAILINNIGVQLTKFNQKENLPLNITAGVSKKLADAPFQFSLTAQRLSIWDNTFNDTNFNSVEGISSTSKYQNIFNHLIFATEVYLGSSVNLTMGYNFLRRFDLNVQNQKNSLNGLSAGCSIMVNNIQMQYANAFFQNNLNHHFTIIYQIKKKY